MRHHALFLLAALLAGCSAAPTPIPVPANSPTASPSPTPTPDNPATRLAIETAAKNIAPYKFAPDGAHPGQYVVVSEPGEPVPHLSLREDGNVYVEMRDGIKTAPSTTLHVFGSYLYAAIYRIDPISGLAEVMTVGDLSQPANVGSVWLTDSLFKDGTYQNWMISALQQQLQVEGGNLKDLFRDADPNMAFHVIDVSVKLTMDVFGDGLPDEFGGEFYLPAAIRNTRDFSLPAERQPYHWRSVPLRQFPAFVVNVDHANMSVFPVLRYTGRTADPYIVYPIACDTNRILSSSNSGKWVLQSVYQIVDWRTQGFQTGGQMIIVSPAVSYTPTSNEDSLGDSDVFKMFIAGINPDESELRSILGGATNTDAGRYIWPVVTLNLLP